MGGSTIKIPGTEETIMKIFKGLLILLVTSALWAADAAKTTDENAGAESPQIEGVDIPTADVLDPATYAATCRIYSEGGIASRLRIQPLNRVNIGITFNAHSTIG